MFNIIKINGIDIEDLLNMDSISINLVSKIDSVFLRGNGTSGGPVSDDGTGGGDTPPSRPVGDRGLFGADNSDLDGYVDTIEYITISTIGNSQYFVDLNHSIAIISGTSNGIGNRGLFVGGVILVVGSPIRQTYIDYITINFISSASDYGDLSNGTFDMGTTSNSQ